MASTFSKHFNLEKPAQGTQNWDTLMNENIDLIEKGPTLKATAGITLSANKVVYLDDSYQFQLATAVAGSTASARHVGFTTNTINQNVEGYARHSGYHDDPDWSFIPGPVYLSESVAGDVTQAGPTTGLTVMVGFAIQTNEILIRPWLDTTGAGVYP